jgi:adenine-specific DNA-methyltransferase
LRKLFGDTPFSYPKPLSLLTTLLQQATGPGDIVLDFFAGSGTTAHAVMQLNAQDGGDRRWIMVSSTEATEQEPEKNLARDVLRERIARAAAAMEVDAQAAYLRCRRIPGEDLPYELSPEDCWRLIRLRHGIPLDDAPPQSPLASAGPGAESGETVCYVDAVTSEAMAMLARHADAAAGGGPPVVAYAWTVGPLRERFGGRVQLREVPADLERGHWR